ncbi:MAG TPA: sodium/proton-translocating pyrophosphatase, partial [Arachnia sp.]|nr:sodium/proton-translocating pyrophosphatase [Arachnia sp.]
MGTLQSPPTSYLRRALWTVGAGAALLLAGCAGGGGQSGEHIGGEANLQLPDLGSITFVGLPGDVLLGLGLIVCALGLGFGVLTYSSLKKMPAHAAMREISELIYTTCKAYLKQQGKFLFLLWAFIATIIVVYYLFLVGFGVGKTAIVIGFSLIGMAGSYGVAWYGIRVNTLANSRTAHAA